MGRGERAVARRDVLRTAGLGLAATTGVTGLSTGLGAAPAQARRRSARDLPMVHAAAAAKLVDFVGVNTHLGFRDSIYEQTERVLATVEDLGVHHIRDRVSALPQLRHAYRELHRRGVLVQGVCSSLEEDAPMRSVMQTVTSDFRRPATVFSGFEPLNEPNGQALPWIVQTRQKTQALRAARDDLGLSAIPVLAPALARVNDGGHEGATTALQATNLGSLSEFVDMGNMHVYPRLQVPSDDIATFKALAKQVAGHKPVVCTEAGYFNAMGYQGGAFPTPLDITATYLPRLVMEHWLRRTHRVYVYELLDEWDPSGTDRESSFGLVSVSGTAAGDAWTPKPAYVALRNLLRIFKDHPGEQALTGLRMSVSGGDDVRSILFTKRNGVGLLALWRDVSSYDPARRRVLPVSEEPVVVQFGTRRRVAQYDPVTSRHPVAHLGTAHRVEVPVADQLVILHIR